MPEHVTLLRPSESTPGTRRSTLALPADLLEQVRGRVRVLAIVLLCAFAIDVLTLLLIWIAQLTGIAPDRHLGAPRAWQWVNIGAVAASAALWLAARNRRVSPARLHQVSLAYEVAICFVIGLLTHWDTFRDHQRLADQTWIPAIIIFFPLIVPGPPRRMLAAAIASAAMSPLAIFVLTRFGGAVADTDAYLEAVLQPALAVAFAYVGARVVYGLGREVAAARELGSYRLDARLGQGGMGEVWLARHRMLARPAAIKIIRPALGDGGASQDARRRFEREAQVIARLRSPHTIDLFDFGVAEDGSFYYAMELLEGLDADELVQRFGPVSSARAIHVLRQICHSLSEASSYGLVHRDIKPSNVFLCRYGEDCDFVKVLDFGLVKATEDPVEAVAGLTRENVVPGTPAFIAPEQALGQTNVDARVDIYALGCVAYWLLTGQLVFAGDTPMALLHQHISAAPVPPSRRVELPISDALDRLVLACLAKDPGARPQSARELWSRLDELEGAFAWSPEEARDWWAVHQPSRAVERPARVGPERSMARDVS